MDYLVKIRKGDPNPAGREDAREWFLHYKWHVEGEEFYPVRPDKHHLFEGIREGDRLWFCLEDDLLGSVLVLRTQEDIPNGYLEIWYDGEQCQDICPDAHLGSGINVFLDEGGVGSPMPVGSA